MLTRLGVDLLLKRVLNGNIFLIFVWLFCETVFLTYFCGYHQVFSSMTDSKRLLILFYFTSFAFIAISFSTGGKSQDTMPFLEDALNVEAIVPL